MLAIANLLLGVLTMVAGQAPGDESELCTVSLPSLGQNIVEDPPKATPSDTLVSGPEVFLIACGRAAFLIMSLSVFTL